MAVYLYSGGQDSATVLAWGLRKGLDGPHVALSFDYGQRNHEELRLAVRTVRLISERFGTEVAHSVLPIREAMQATGRSAMLGHGELRYDRPVPTSFVPVRNLTFLSLASALAASGGHRQVVVGCCKDDRKTPDTRPEFLRAAERAINLSVDHRNQPRIKVLAPLGDLFKWRVFKMAEELGVLDIVMQHTLTCHAGKMNRHEWGYGCDNCGVCWLRAEAWAKFKKHRRRVRR